MLRNQFSKPSGCGVRQNLIYHDLRTEILVENETFIGSPQFNSHPCPTSLWGLQLEDASGKEDTGQGLVDGLPLCCPSDAVFQGWERNHQGRERGQEDPSLYREVGEKEKDLLVLAWRWKVSNVVRSAIETKKDRFDAAARVMAVFGRERGFKVIEGTEPSGPRIEYIWASHLPPGHIFDHPGEKYCKVFVLESGDRKAGEWVFEKRNLHEDYKKAFGTEPSGVLAIGIQTDTDHSNEMVTAYYSDPILKKK